MLQDTDFFDKLAQWSTLGDVHAHVEWAESPSPDERYDVTVTWRYRSSKVGEGRYVIEPVVGTDEYRLFWTSLAFIDEWQAKGLYTELVKLYASYMPAYHIAGVATVPWDKEAERRLASQGFEWVDHDFYLAFAESHTEGS
jgi:hypothetical protein